MKTVNMDIRGQICPSSLLLVLREVNRQHQQLLAGDLCMVILTDNRDATGTVPDALKNMGITTIVEKMAGHYRLTIQRQYE